MITKTTKPWHAITFYFMSLRRIWLPFLHSFPSGIYKHWLDPSWVFLFSRLSHLCRDFRLIYTSVVCQLIQHVYGSLLLGSLKLDTAFQAWPDQGGEERTFIPLLPVILPQCRPWLSWCFFFLLRSSVAGFWSIHCLPGLWNPSLAELLGLLLTKSRTLRFHFLSFMNLPVPLSSLLRLPSRGYQSLQFCVICKLAEDAFCPIT